MEKPVTCRMCPTPLEQPATGRPAIYCSQVCRRAAEFELRRAQALLLRAEKKLMDVRAAHAQSYDKPATRKVLKHWQAEVAAYSARVRELLAAGSEVA